MAQPDVGELMASQADPHPLPKAPAPLRRVPVPEAQTPPGWIILGPRLRGQMGPQLERLMPLVWLALLEMSGAQEGAPYRLCIDGAHLEPAPPNGAVP